MSKEAIFIWVWKATIIVARGEYPQAAVDTLAKRYGKKTLIERGVLTSEKGWYRTPDIVLEDSTGAILDVGVTLAQRPGGRPVGKELL